MTAVRRLTDGVTMDQFLGGDWRGALVTVATGLGAMVGVALVAVLLAGAGGVDGHAVLAATFAAVAAALGGSVHASGFGQAELGTLEVMPLTLTLVGLGLIGWRFVRTLPHDPAATRIDIALQAARTALVFLGLLLIVGILGRYTVMQGTGFGPESEVGRLAVSVSSTVFGGLVWLIVTLAAAAAVARPAALPPRLRRIRGHLSIALVPVAWLTGVALIAGLIAGLLAVANSNAPTQAFGVVLLMAPNLAFGLLLLALGVPAHGFVAGGTGLFGGALTGTNQSLTLLTLTDHNAAWWLLPLAAAAVLLGGAFVAVSRAGTRDEMRQVAYWLGLALAVGLLLMAITTGVTASVAPALPLFGSIAVHFDGVLALILGAVWGLLAGFIAVAARMSSTSTGRASSAPPPRPTPPAPRSSPASNPASAAERYLRAATVRSDATRDADATSEQPGEQPVSAKAATSMPVPPSATTRDGRVSPTAPQS